MSAIAAILVSLGEPKISLSNVNNEQTVTDPANALSEYVLNNTGDINSGDYGQWINPKVAINTYEARATLVSGALTTGTLNAWLSLGTTRNWTVVRNSIGAATAVFTIEIRKIGTTNVLATATITLTAIVEP